MGPLHGVKVVEIAGIGPGPFCAMLLADLGAEVVRVDRPQPALPGLLASDPKLDLLNRGKRSIVVDLKEPRGVETVLRLVDGADALIEGFRPGVMERLGLGPDVCLARNPRLVYGRMTGFGQTGPLAQAAGHDINYIALAGALYPIGRAGEPPVVPLNLVGDFGGGGMLLGLGLVSALFEASRSHQGQVVDAAMVDGAALLMTLFYGMARTGLWQEERGVNLLDGGAHFYGVYETSDGQAVAIGPLEPQFYAELLARLGLSAAEFPQLDRARWPELRARLAAIFKTETRATWCTRFEGSSACFAPVLAPAEAPHHPHHQARQTFTELDGVVQPSPAPRFSRTTAAIRRPPPAPGADTDAVLAECGLTQEDIAALRQVGAIR